MDRKRFTTTSSKRGMMLEVEVKRFLSMALVTAHSLQVLAGTRGDAWCNGEHVCFPSLPPMLLHGFESRLGLESSGCSM